MMDIKITESGGGIPPSERTEDVRKFNPVNGIKAVFEFYKSQNVVITLTDPKSGWTTKYERSAATALLQTKNQEASI